MLRVAMQVLTQLGVVVGALVAGISDRISSVETIAPGAMSDVGVLGVAAAAACGLVLIFLAFFEAASAARAERRLRDIHGKIQEFFRPESVPMTAFGSQAAPTQTPTAADLPAKDAAQVLKLIAELPEQEQHKILEVLSQSRGSADLHLASLAALLGRAAVLRNAGLLPGILRWTPPAGVSGLLSSPADSSLRLRLKPTPKGSGFWGHFFKTLFVPFSLRDRP